MFTALEDDEVVWSKDERERVDVIILATGLPASLACLPDVSEAMSPRSR